MKRIHLIIAALVVTGFMLQAGQAKAQTSLSKKEQEKKLLKQKELTKEQEKKYQEAMDLYRDLYRVRERDRDFFVTPPPPPVFWGVGTSDKSFNLSLRKNFSGESTSKKTSFTVDDDQKKLRFSVKGSCLEGSRLVNFILPSGKSFSEIEIDSSADIEWSQSLIIEDRSIYKGQWKVEVKAREAKGMYSVSISSY